MKIFLKTLSVFMALILLSACGKGVQSSTNSSEKNGAACFQQNNSDNGVASAADASSDDSGATVSGGDNVMTDIFSESEENTAKQEKPNSSDASGKCGVSSVTADIEQDKENTQASEEWSKRY